MNDIGYYGCKVHNAGPGVGRIIVAEKSITEGSVVCRSPAIAVSAIQEHKKRLCASCLRYGLKRLEKKCAACNQAWFCDDQGKCEELRSAAVDRGEFVAAPHAEVCPALAHFSSASSRFDKAITSILRLMVEIMYQQAVENGYTPESSVPLGSASSRASTVFGDEGLDSLGHHPEVWDAEEVKELSKPFSMLIGSVQSCAWVTHVPDMSVESLQRIFSQVESNVFWCNSSAGLLVGQAVYPLAAMFNHSCNPNCAVDDRSSTMLTVSAVRDISAGEELSITYIALDQPVATRRKILSMQYRFQCSCERCAEELAKGKSDHKMENPRPKQLDGDGDDDEAAVSSLSIRSIVKKMKPGEIKKELKAAGLSTQGTRSDILERLVRYRENATSETEEKEV